MGTIAVFGATGFVGRSCTTALVRAGHTVRRQPARRLWTEDEALLRAPSRVLGSRLGNLVPDLAGVDAVVNAAGLAHPGARASPTLTGANAAWPALLARACEEAGVPRLVHVSTAAVQGRAEMLDESTRYAPVNPYARSKTLGERLLTDAAARGRLGVTLFRPPSVHGPDRDVTRAFAVFCRRWPLVTCGDGRQPVPVALIANVGAAIAAVVADDTAPLVVAHPGEGHTVRTLYETFAPGKRLHPVPEQAVRAALRAAEPAGRWLPPISAFGRRAEVVLLGQRQDRGWLEQRGFRLPYGRQAWADAARAARAV